MVKSVFEAWRGDACATSAAMILEEEEGSSLMTERPSVLFVCVHNAGRSQMAAGYLRELRGPGCEVRNRHERD